MHTLLKAGLALAMTAVACPLANAAERPSTPQEIAAPVAIPPSLEAEIRATARAAGGSRLRQLGRFHQPRQGVVDVFARAWVAGGRVRHQLPEVDQMHRVLGDLGKMSAHKGHHL